MLIVSQFVSACHSDDKKVSAFPRLRSLKTTLILKYIQFSSPHKQIPQNHQLDMKEDDQLDIQLNKKNTCAFGLINNTIVLLISNGLF